MVTGRHCNVIKVKVAGTSIKVYRNGTENISTTSTQNQTGTKVGVGFFDVHGTSGTRFDDFVFDDLSGGGSGTPGSVSFASRQTTYQTSATAHATKQAVCLTAAAALATRQCVYLVASALFDTIQVINGGGTSVSYATRQTIYSTSSTRAAAKVSIYGNGSAAYATRQTAFQLGRCRSSPAAELHMRRGKPFIARLAIHRP